MRPAESFVGQPVRSLQTMLRVIAEDDPSLPTVVPDGIYGPTTMTAVTAFQRRHGIPITGVVDQPTWEQIVLAYEPALIRIDKAEPIEIVLEPGQIFRQGDTNPYLYLMQSMLTVLSKDHPTIIIPTHTGVLDAPSVQALTAFQVLAGLPATGELDRITWKHLSRHFTHAANQQIRRY